ncbi:MULTISPECIES: thiamine phosphate synthase [unclassified Psychrobacter]|uniref:thiamine phosphate synthase n=1 Tax=unclassified Psychrobacter TaxID=196806 RepID=UPI0018F2A617|nr:MULTISPECIES: thiamine phosphate synthase [unclassified Psychrobacter]
MTKDCPPVTPKLYLLTNDDPLDVLQQKLSAAFATGAVGLLQIRRKQVLAQENGREQLYTEAQSLIALAQQYNVPVVMNDDMAMADKLGVGVHLGQQDGSVFDARAQLAAGQIVGRTCHGDAELVKDAQAAGADYAAMGAIFASTTKPNATTISKDALMAGAATGVPICVIGGLTPQNVVTLAGIPLRYVAVVGDIMDLPVDKIAARCEEWQVALAQLSAAL